MEILWSLDVGIWIFLAVSMSKKPNPTSIGLFFVIGLALCVAGLLVFSSRSLFHPQQKCILYFNASLKGLNPGPQSKFAG